MAGFRQPIGEIDILVVGLGEGRIEAASQPEDRRPKRRRIGVDEVDGRLALLKVVAFLEFALRQPGHGLSLSCLVAALDAGHAGVAEWLQHQADPIGGRLAVGVGEEEDIARGCYGAGVARGCGAAMRAGDDVIGARSGCDLSGGVRRAIVDNDDLVTRTGIRLEAKRPQGNGQRPSGVIGRDDYGHAGRLEISSRPRHVVHAFIAAARRRRRRIYHQPNRVAMISITTTPPAQAPGSRPTSPCRRRYPQPC